MKERIYDVIGYAIYFLCFRRIVFVVGLVLGGCMSKWADLYTRYDDTVHTVPMDVPKIPPRDKVRDHVFGHIPLIVCPCKPHVRFSTNGEYLVITHRDHERGGISACGEDLH